MGFAHFRQVANTCGGCYTEYIRETPLEKGNNMGKSWTISVADIGKDGWLTPPKEEEETPEEEGEE